jgi:hypothetical protein
MSILNEPLTSAPKPIERLRPLLKNPEFWQDLLNRLRAPNSKSNSIQWDETKNGPFPPSLQLVLKQRNSFPPYSTIIGICDDGLPFLLDLTNPAPGSILITGDTDSGKTRLMKSILKSALSLNPINKVEINLLSANTGAFAEISNAAHCKKFADHSDQAMMDIIEELAEITDQRRRTKPQDPAIILAIDDLAALSEVLDHQVFATLYWLIKHGPRSRVWPIVSINAEESPNIDPRLLAAFRTRLVGHLQNRKLAASITDHRRLDVHKLEKGMQFFVPYGDEWIPFWICDPQ